MNKGFDTVGFTTSLFISPDLDGHRAQGTPTEACFTICLFISPDLDGNINPHDMFHDMFVH